MKKNRNKKFIICILVLIVLTACVVIAIRPKKSIDSRFDVAYMSAERFEEILTDEFNAKKTKYPEMAKSFSSEYNVYRQQIGSVEFTVYTFVSNCWGRQTCDYCLFDSTDDAYMYFDALTNRFAGVLTDNEYYIEASEGYCLVNASGVMQKKYVAYYFKDNMVITVSQSGYLFFSGNDKVMNRICSELGVETPVGLPGNEEVRRVYYGGGAIGASDMSGTI